jgi:hypothetical protein
MEARNALPDDLVRKHRVCPFRLEGKNLAIAMINPKDAVAISAIESATGMVVDVWITSEFRLEKALHRHFGIRPSGRRGLSVGTLRSSRKGESPDAEGGTDAGEPAGAEPELGLDGLPLDAEITFDDHLFHHGTMGLPEESEEPEESPGDREETGSEPDPLADLEFRLADAVDRTSIAEALMDYCLGIASRSALFALSKDGIRCIAARGRGMESEQVFQAVIPNDDGSIFDTALRGGEFYLGPVAPLPANKDLYSLFGGRIPPLVLVLPVKVRNRTIALLYMDNDDRPLGAPDLPLLKRIGTKAGLAFQILILRNKLRAI